MILSNSRRILKKNCDYTLKMVVLLTFGSKIRLAEGMHTIGNAGISTTGRFTGTITSHIKDGSMLKPFQSIFITAQRITFARVISVMRLRQRLESF